jgi:hypothetical protein
MAEEPKRNQPCPCGSGKKYKHCCMNKPKNEFRAELAKEKEREKTPAEKAAEMLALERERVGDAVMHERDKELLTQLRNITKKHYHNLMKPLGK